MFTQMFIKNERRKTSEESQGGINIRRRST